MDPPKTTKKEKKYPRVPIKTYKWEDIKRSRRKGGYPWTYLYKQPYNEHIDSEQFTMNSLRKSKSSSTVGNSEGVEISDVTDREESEPKHLDTLQIVTEPDDRSARNSIGSLIIEECEMSDAAEADPKPETMVLESADSSDNISQYLDKEDRVPEKEYQVKKTDTPNQETEGDKGDASYTVEDQSKRKRKMSAESSYSRISSTKDAVLKKIRDTKNKIKIPKLSFPVKKIKKPIPKPTKNVSSEPKKDVKKKASQSKDIKPVYIHIPLKPPPGETDEFSYLEFEDSPKPASPPVKGVGGFKFLAKNIKRLQENVPNSEEVSDDKSIKKDTVMEDKTEDALLKNKNEEQCPTQIDDKSIQDIEGELQKDENKEALVKNKNVDVQKTVDKTTDINENIEDNKEDRLQVDKYDSDEVDVGSEKSNNEEGAVAENVETDTENNAKSIQGIAEKRGILKKSAEFIDKSNRETQKNIPKEKQERAKSEEPEKKRKLSLESSYSRKSLSKLEIMKKLKETSEKIKKTFSINKKKKETSQENIKTPKETQPKKKVKKQKVEKPVKPVYIHIPLKSSEEEKMSEKDNTQPSPPPPDSPVPNDVQFIILTAPSDDEILDYHSSDVPETPSSDNRKFFDGKIEELRKLAKDVVDDVSQPVASHKLESVTEETLNDNKSDKDVAVDVTLPTSPEIEDSPENTKTEEHKVHKEVDQLTLKKHDEIKEKIMIDVEDGLSESIIKEELPDNRQTTSNENVLRESEATLNLEQEPSVKKKVSFKRRSKTSKDGSYEEIGPQDLSKISSTSQPQPQEAKDLTTPDTSNEVTDDTQMNLDLDEPITTSPKDDEDKWSKASDHEYEPVNPPPEVQIFISAPTINIEDISNKQPGDIHPEISNNRSDVPVDNRISYRTDSPSVSENERVANLPSQQLDDRNQDIDHSITEKNKDPNKFQLAWKQTTNQFKNKLQNFKKAHTSQDDTPKTRKIRKPKFDKPRFSLPKIPDTSKINLPSLPSFHLPRRVSADGKRSPKEPTDKQSTDSNVGDSKKITFDFSTVPRIFKKKSKPKNEQKQELDLAVHSSTEQDFKPKIWEDDKIVRISLHTEESISDENLEKPNDLDIEYKQSDDDNNEYLNDDQITSHMRYKDDIDIEDEFEGQTINNDDYLNRWNRGNFNPETDNDYRRNFEILRYQVTDLDFPNDRDHHELDYNSSHNRERYSSGSSFGGQRVGGVIEEINADEFFLRQKGISQDNIEVGMYLSSEIKEAFRTPDNALSKMEHREFDLRDSNQYLPESPKKHKPIKKPKRKKTPHVSQEKIRVSDSDSDDDDFGDIPPSRPKRRSKRISKTKNIDNVIPYQETIHLETDIPHELENTHVLNNYEKPVESTTLQANDRFHYPGSHTDSLNFEYIDESQIEKPAAPPRKHKSLKSLTSENDSILEDISQIQTPETENELKRINDDFVTTSAYPIQRPARKKSRSSLQSATSLQSKEALQKDEDLSSGSQLFTYENQTPCVEEPCVQDIRDYMGYAIIDKQKIRDPPLPPPRPPGRKKRSTNSEETNFFTVPRQSRYDNTPVRPLRNYSTLGQTKKISEPVTYENKENIDIIQYSEIEDDSNRHLQSGDIIRKMKDRPLPAPPRPPRKSRFLQNITSKENIMEETNGTSDRRPVSDDDTCDIEGQEFTIENTVGTNSPVQIHDTENIRTDKTEKFLITPNYFTHQETITHGSLLVQSLNGSKIIPDSELTRIIPISVESDDETSSVPEDFKNLKDPPEIVKSSIPTNINSPSPTNTEVDILKAHKLQVVDLDIGTLTVNELLAGKIIVSEIDSDSIRTDKLHSKSGKFEVKFPETKKSEVTTSDSSQQVCIEEEKAQCVEATSQTDKYVEEKKTSPNANESQVLNETEELDFLKQTRSLEKMSINSTKENLPDQTYSFNQESLEDVQNEPPEPPPRSSTVHMDTNFEIDSECSQDPLQQSDKNVLTTSNDEVLQEPDVDDEPPPRPPQPHLDYIPSQPPASFYALRAQKYLDTVESNIPKIPRRKRPPRSISRSSSDDSLVTPVSRRTYNRSPEPSISQLSGQLIRACGSTAHNALRRLITDITNNLRKNTDGKLDLHVMTIILLILVAGLILLGYGEEKTVVHLHHWEYFNPPKDL